MNEKAAPLDRAYDSFKLLEKLGLVVSGSSLIITMAVITVDVVVRNFTQFTLVGVYEIVQNYLMPLMVFPAIGYAYSSGIMPRIVMVTDRLGLRAKRIAALLISATEVMIFALMAYFTFGYAVNTVEQRLSFICSTRMLPLYHVMFLPVFSFLMIVIENVFLLLVNIKDKSAKFTYR